MKTFKTLKFAVIASALVSFTLKPAVEIFNIKEGSVFYKVEIQDNLTVLKKEQLVLASDKDVVKANQEKYDAIIANAKTATVKVESATKTSAIPSCEPAAKPAGLGSLAEMKYTLFGFLMLLVNIEKCFSALGSAISLDFLATPDKAAVDKFIQTLS